MAGGVQKTGARGEIIKLIYRYKMIKSDDDRLKLILRSFDGARESQKKAVASVGLFTSSSSS